MNRVPTRNPLYYFTTILMAPGLWVVKIIGIDFCQACGKLKLLRWPIFPTDDGIRFCRKDCAEEFVNTMENRTLPLLMRMAGRRRRW